MSTESKPLALGSDHAGLALKNHLAQWLESQNIAFQDYGVFNSDSMDYPDIAQPVAEAVAHGTHDKGILICGSGIGINISANKVNGVRAAQCHDPVSAKLSRQHNDANILTLGERIITPLLAENIVDVWLNTAFEGGRHQRRVNKIHTLETP
tara:strand:- start:7 stop:462 length:456 start_codon:yes stop_codon:yes gene_type:complete